MISRLRALGLLLLLAALPAHSATVTSSAEPPAVDGWDQAALGSSSVTDKWWVGGAGWGAGAVMGQTFTTGDKPVQLSALTFRICESCKAEPVKAYAIRLGSVTDKTFTLLHQEKAEQTEPFVTGGYVTWRFEKPIPLHPRTKYGVDVDMLSSTSGWQTGIPYLQRFPVDKHPGGESYSPSGEGYTALRPATGDRVFHLDLEASDGSSAPPTPIVVPEPPGGSTGGAAVSAKGKKVAIVGDGLAADPALAEAVQKLLGDSHQVKGFGVAGSTALTATEKPWGKEFAARDAIVFAPQIVVVHLGATDTRPANRGKLETWGKDYQDLVISLMQIRGAEAIWLCIPLVTENDRTEGADAAVFSDKLEVPLRLAAVETGAVVIDLPQEIKSLDATLPPAHAAAARLAEMLSGRKPDLSRLAASEPAKPPPAPAPTPAPVASTPPAPTPAAPVKPVAAKEPIRVACVGDALDVAFTTAAEMGKILGKSHEVKSFQAVDTLLLNTEKQTYLKSGKLAEARAFKPQVVVITLAEPTGAEPSFKQTTAFDRELRLMLNDLLTWTPRPAILLASPVPKDDGKSKPAPAPAPAGKSPPKKEEKRKSNTQPIVDRARAAFRLLPADLAAILRDDKLMPKDGKGNPLPAQGYARKLAEAVQAADGP